MNGFPVSQKTVARLMRKNKIRSRVNRKSQIWVSDITYINTAQGWLYLTVILDLYDHKIVGWSMSDKINTSRKGNCWDNAVAESFFKSLKVEAI